MHGAPTTGSGRTPTLTLSGVGRLMVVTGIVFLLAGTGLAQRALLFTGACLILLPGIAMLLAAVNQAALDYRRLLPGLIARGEPVSAVCELTNRKRLFGAFDVRIRDTLPCSSRSLHSCFAALLPRTTDRTWLTLTMPTRGIIGEVPYDMDSSFPLGLARSHRTGVIRGSLVVYPDPVVPGWMERMLDAGAGHGGAHLALSEGMGDFRALRDYHPGDPIRLVSWPFSSRRDTLVVREMELPAPQCVGIVFHSYRPSGAVLSRQRFEETLSILSGLAHRLRELRIPFMIAGSFTNWQLRIIHPDDALAFESFLISLARATQASISSLEPVMAAVNAASRAAHAVWIVSNTPRRYWIDQLDTCVGHLIAADVGGMETVGAAAGSRRI